MILGKSRTPESRMEIEESRSRWEFWSEATQPVREAIVPFNGGFDISCCFSGVGGVSGVFLLLEVVEEPHTFAYAG